MKIVIAMDSFKGSLTAPEACRSVAAGLHKANPNFEVVEKPMADGGEGTAEAVRTARNGRWIPQTVTGPYYDTQVEAGFVWLEEEQAAVIEMASASGLTLLEDHQLNPEETTTYGTGELIRHAIEYGAKRILLGVGGSATNDGGTGAAAALGCEFLDINGNHIDRICGEKLSQIAEFNCAGRSIDIPVEVLCDVDNPFYGPDGAACTYAAQKGADPNMIQRLDQGLQHFASMIRMQIGMDLQQTPGAGAAGGLAGGAMAFLNAKLVSGIERIMQINHLSEAIKDADWIITGEGKFDNQSLRGKVVCGVLKESRKYNKPVTIIAGTVEMHDEDTRKHGIQDVISTQPLGISIARAMKNAANLLRDTAKNYASKCFEG